MKPTKSRITILPAIAVMSFAFPSANAAVVISNFQFTSGSSASTDAEANTTTSDITFGGGIVGAAFTGDRLEIDGADTTAQDTTNTLVAQLNNAITNEMYFTFTVTIPNTQTVNLTDLTFNYGTDNTTNDFVYFATGSFTDKTGFATADDSLSDIFVNGETRASAPIAADLSSITSLQNLTNTTVEFRLYVSDGSNSATRIHLFDDVSLSGTVVPEPSTALLGGVGMLALLRRRR